MLRSRGWAIGWTVLRAAMSLLIAAAVIVQAATTIGGAVANGRDVGTTVANFFSFFTVLSNISAVVVLTTVVVWFAARGRDATTEPRSIGIALACASTYMIVTGIVYNLLLRSIQLPQGTTVPWSNEIVHLVAPLFLLADVFVGPLRRKLPWRAVGEVLIFPIVWIAYTLVRGPLVTSPLTGEAWWYPYPFLDPNRSPAGYLSVAGYVVGIAVAIAIVAFFVVWIGRRRGVLPVGDPVVTRAVSPA